MTQTIISLLSILFGILGASIFGKLKPKFSLGLTSNIIVGVFGSILILKTFGRLGFTPNHIVVNQNVNYILLLISLMISGVSGILCLVIIYKIKRVRK
ncbi:hypothetical protein ACXGQW_01970 [Wenyingzhuangia sp. IMCC45533]